MSGFFFGPAGRQLYGYFHDGGYSATGAVLLCPPWGVEYEHSHRALRMLASQLADRGRHVLRFDYSGTGDSWGETTDATLEQWYDDVALAIRELQMLSGSDRVSLVGLRLGGHVALTVAARNPAVESVVLWDPVLDGALWTQELAQRLRAPVFESGTVEFGHSRISARFYQQLAGFGPPALSELGNRPGLLLTTHEQPAAPNPQSPLAGAALEVEHIADISPWIEEVAITQGQVPARALRRIVAWFEERTPEFSG